MGADVENVHQSPICFPAHEQRDRISNCDLLSASGWEMYFCDFYSHLKVIISDLIEAGSDTESDYMRINFKGV